MSDTLADLMLRNQGIRRERQRASNGHRLKSLDRTMQTAHQINRKGSLSRVILYGLASVKVRRSCLSVMPTYSFGAAFVDPIGLTRGLIGTSYF